MPSIYTIQKFDASKAKVGALCAVVSENNPSTILGVGICKKETNDRFSIIIEGITYLFEGDGSARSKITQGYVLKLAVLNEGGFTRADDEEEPVNVEEDAEKKKAFRDKVACDLLPILIQSMDNPSDATSSEMFYYCQKAYKWADMMYIVSNIE